MTRAVRMRYAANGKTRVDAKVSKGLFPLLPLNERDIKSYFQTLQATLFLKLDPLSSMDLEHSTAQNQNPQHPYWPPSSASVSTASALASALPLPGANPISISPLHRGAGARRRQHAAGLAGMDSMGAGYIRLCSDVGGGQGRYSGWVRARARATHNAPLLGAAIMGINAPAPAPISAPPPPPLSVLQGSSHPDTEGGFAARFSSVGAAGVPALRMAFSGSSVKLRAPGMRRLPAALWRATARAPIRLGLVVLDAVVGPRQFGIPRGCVTCARVGVWTPEWAFVTGSVSFAPTYSPA
ncbi:hypothetical protein B0H11DRAFT_1906244 [Mycena galericulata]|nr:hypothetical protein B0H11DRAFT_1906244 [Mycena galericulata]